MIRRIRIGVLVAVLLVCSSCLLAQPAFASLTVAQLRTLNAEGLAAERSRLDTELATVGGRMLENDAEVTAASGHQLKAEALLSDFAVQMYMSGGNVDVLAEVVSAGSISDFYQRATVMQEVGEYRHRLVSSYNQSRSEVVQRGALRRGLVQRLTRLQQDSQRVDIELRRRELIRRHQMQVAEKARAARLAKQQAAAKSEAEAAALAAQAARQAQLVSFAGLAASTATYVPAGPPSAQAIDAYLVSKGSPMAGNGQNFYASGARWQVDPRLLVAIAGAESSFGNITCGPHNAWGWACPNDPADFGTWADGIDTVAEGLRRYYLDEGRTSVVLIQQKYAPSGADNDPTGLNNHWVKNVSKFLMEQGGDPNRVGPGVDIGGIPDPVAAAAAIVDSASKKASSASS